MNGEIPSVPITTLAGVSSLTDLLPEMPLPSPLPQTLSNKSLLFHPRVAEEAQILLSHPNELLIPQLVHSLSQTTSEHIELKDQYAGTEQPLEHQADAPELLKAILLKNSAVFKGPARNQQWKQQPQQLPQQQQQAGHSVNSTFNQSSPASYGQGSPGYTRHTPQGSPAQPASARLVVPEDKSRPPQPSPNIGFHEPNSIPQRASVIAGGLEQNRPYNDLSENKLNPNQGLADWQKRKSENELFSTDSQRVGGLHTDIPDYNRPEVHPSHRGTDNTLQRTDFAPGNFQPLSNNANDLINSMRNFRPQKTHGQSSQDPYVNSLDQRLLPTLQPGSSPAQASIASEENLNKYNKKDSTLLDNSGTSTSVQKDPASSESEYTPRSDTSSGVSSGGSSSVVTLGSNDSLLSCTPTLEGSDKLVPVLNFQTGEIEYKPEGTDKPGNKTDEELYDIDKFKRKVLQRNSSVNNGIGEPLFDSNNGKGNSTKDTDTVFSEMQKNMKPPASVKRSDSVSSNGSASKIKPAFVRLNRLSEKDQALMQKSLSEFAQQQPNLANKLGITSQNHRKTKPSIIESDSDDDDDDDDDEGNKSKSRIFKSRDRDKARDAKKNKDASYVPPSFQDNDDRSRKRRRSAANHDDAEEPIELPKPKVRKVERKMVPVLEKLSIEELMETNTYQRFNTTIDRIFENTDDLDLTIELDDSEDVPPEALIPKYQLQDLCAEAAKLKTLGAMESIPATRLVKLLNILEKNIRDGARVSPIADPEDDEEESKLWLELAMERVMRAMDASLTAIYILTSPNMPKRIYLEDVIDRIVLFTKFQLTNTIYPSFDPVYRVNKKGKDGYQGSARKKRSQGHQVREKSILQLYTKLHGLVGLLAELLNIQILTDTAVLHASSMAVSPFFVEEVSELQLSALKLVTTIFTKYEKHRRLLLDDILASIARLPSSKRSLRTYRLNSEENIQMLTALVLQLIQCVVILPENLKSKSKEKEKEKETKDGEATPKDKINMDRDVQIVSKYETSMKIAGNFLSVFLSKCGSKNEEIDYRPLFENFVQDLLTTVNKPEWPAAEVLLSLLGKLLVSNFMNKGTDMALRVASLDYLGVVAARLRKDYVTSHRKLASIDQMISEIKAAESKDNDDKSKKTEDLDPEEERTQFLQRVLLDYLAVNGQSDPAWTCARHFYLAQWYHDCMTSKSKQSHSPSKSNKKNKRKKRKSESSEEEISEPSDHDDEDDLLLSEANTTARFQIMEARKQFLLSKIKPFSDESGRTNILQTYIDYTSADLISRFLSSKRPFSLSFDGYLQQILRVLAETSIAIRTKAIKCLTMVVEADPSVLGMKSMQMGVRVSFLDHATSVREAAVDLVGKFVLSRPELIDKYYDMLSARILDTGVSVRKRVIKILRDICIECPEFPKIPEICVKMIRRVNDEEGIRKLVMEVFQNMWFTPVKDRPQLDHRALLRKVMNITEVVATSSKDMGLEWFEQLLVSLFKPKEDKDDSTKVIIEPPKALITACTQIVDCLIENVLKLEEQGNQGKEFQGSSQRLVACLTTLYLFAKIRPQLLVNHAITLQPYLSLKCQTQGDYQIVSNVARTLELIVPLMEHPSETFLAQLEEDSVKLILQHDRIVVASCLSCLGSIVNNVTKNFKLIRDCFQKYYGYLIKIREHMEKDITKAQLEAIRPACKRALFTVGLLMRHFDFTDRDVREGLPDDIKDQVFSTLFFFVHDPSPDIQHYTMIAIGSLCIRHYEFMLGKDLKQLYYKLLTDPDAPLSMRAQVLNNIEMYLQEEELRMIRQDQEWSKLSKQENLKEMGDVSSGMASTVIQLYIKEILDAFLHHDVTVRKAALKVIQLILQQGLVHPVQIVPYLICMSTDVEKVVSHSADKQLQEIEKKYPGFIHMKAQLGIKLSYRLQRIMQGNDIVRGFRTVEGEVPGALNGFLYSILRTTKQQRRAIALSVLKQFDEQVKTSLAQMLYLADNLAYFPYQVQDEPLFIVHHIDVMISMSGTNLLQSFREALIPPANQTTRIDPNTGQVEVIYDEDEDEDELSLLNRVPEDTTVLQECITASQGCLLLLVLKQHLKDLYGLTDAKIAQYSPSESAKIYEKAVNRKSNSNFNPKATLSKLRQGDPPRILDQAQRKALIDQYLDFKQLMLKYDPDEDDDDAPPQSQTPHTPHTPHHGSAHTPSATPDTPHGGLKVTYNLSNTPTGTLQDPLSSPANVTPNPAERGNFPYTQQDTRDVAPGKIPKLTIVTPRPPEKDSLRSHRHKSHKSDKQKKHRHKKRKKYSDDESDDNEFSDPDFLV